MRVLVFSDIHGDTRALEKIVAQPADIYVANGDLSTFGRGLDRCGEILAPMGERLWVLPGNHESHEESREFCRRFGFVDFHRQVRRIGGTTWAGLGYSNITPFKTPGEYTEEQIAEALAAFDGLARFILWRMCRREIRNWMNLLRENMPGVRLCGRGLSESSRNIYFAGISTNVRVGKR